MQYRCISTSSDQRTFVVVLATGDEILSSLQEFVQKERVHVASFTAIGALSDASLRYFDWEKKEYQKIPVREQVEVASLIGDVAEGPDGKPTLHVHIVLARAMAALRQGISARDMCVPRSRLS